MGMHVYYTVIGFFTKAYSYGNEEVLDMSKTGWIILIVCLALVFCIAAGLLLAGRIFNTLLSKGSDTTVDTSATKDYKDLKSDYSTDGVYTVQLKDLKELDIDWISGSVTVALTDEDVVRFVETAQKEIKEKDALRYGVSGDTLRIQACKKGYVGKLPEKDLTVYLPRTLADGMKECEIDTVSAAVTAGSLKLDELEIDTVSGRVKLTNMTLEEAQLDSVSGVISLLDSAIGSLRTDSVSGEVKVSGSVTKVKSSSVSGPFELTLNDCKDIRLSTVSGAMTLDLGITPQGLRIDTTSGKTRLTLPQDAACAIRLEAVSGKLYLNEEAVTGKQLTLGDGGPSFDIDSMSGSVYVYTK